MAESELGFPYRGWERFFDAIGPRYGAMLREAMNRARAELADTDDEQLALLVRQGREAASSLDEEGARQTVRLHDERDQNAALASSLDQEAQTLLEHAPRGWSRRRRAEQRQAQDDAAELRPRAESHRQLAANAQDEIRILGEQGRHLYDWFERNRDAVALGLAAEQSLNTVDRAAYHVLGAPSIASLTAACLTAERAIKLNQLVGVVEERGDERQRLLLDVAIELRSGADRQLSLSELMEHLHGEDLDRVLEAIAIRRRRAIRGASVPTDLWIRAAEPDGEQER